jgi:hypothetical protein
MKINLKRLCTIYFPYGASVPKDDHEHGDWGWFPVLEGNSFRYTKVMQSLNPLREYVSVVCLIQPVARSVVTTLAISF